jgi:chorismate synthase
LSGNSFGNIFKITSWGESHGEAIGAVIEGCPPNILLSEKDIQTDLDKRKPGKNIFTSNRKEDDIIEIMSGVFKGKTTGMPISLIIKNTNYNSSSYENIKDLFRPGHADYTYYKKYGIRDYRGGGRSSGRETAMRVAAGSVAKKIIQKLSKVKIIAHAKQIGKIKSQKINLDYIEKNPLRCADIDVSKKMEKEILEAKNNGDSIGGIVEIIVKNCPIGLGNPVFDKLDADLCKALMSIGSVKAIEFGDGFNVASMKGSENNDLIRSKGFKTNHSGGILGGISTGQDIIIRIAVKPTPSIMKKQETIDKKGNEKIIQINGNHDPCIVPRIIPVAKAMVLIVIADHILMQRCVK